jgi:hypothetical protein
MLMRGPSGAAPSVPITFFMIAVPANALRSISPTCHVTFGALSGTRP